MHFTKMEGLGNDYIYLDCTQKRPEDLPQLARVMSDRHFGVGGDGLICICPSQKADFFMEMYNADGSQGEMCGNGIRCVGKFVYDRGLISKTELSIETLAGIKELNLTRKDGKVTEVTVDMGRPIFESACQLPVAGGCYTVYPVSMGNPHAVLYWQGIDGLDLPLIGPQFECHPRFPNRTNTEFVEVVNPQELRMRVWERGSGETLACGTGACAVLAASAANGLCLREAVVHLLGGDLRIRWSEENDHIYMTGPAVTVFEGEWDH